MPIKLYTCIRMFLTVSTIGCFTILPAYSDEVIPNELHDLPSNRDCAKQQRPHWLENSAKMICRRCAADPDLPTPTIQYREQYTISDMRYHLPSEDDWHTQLTPRAFFGEVAPVFWQDLDAEKHIGYCETGLAESIAEGSAISGSVHYGRMLLKSGKLKEAAEQFELHFQSLEGRTTILTESAAYLGRMYEAGLGVNKDLARAVDLYNNAIESERLSDDKEYYWPAHPRAQHNLASLYFWGKGVAKDRQMAASLWHDAAKHYQVHSIANLAFLYRRGQGVRANLEISANLYQLATQILSLREYAPDMLIINEDRFGVYEPSEDVSVEWLWKAANAQQREAIITLAYMYHVGKVVNQDLDQALDLYEQGVRLFGLSPEYSPGPAFVDSESEEPAPWEPAWTIEEVILEEGVTSRDEFSLAFNGVYLEHLAEMSEDRMELLKSAQDYYERSKMPNALHRAGRIILMGHALEKQDENSNDSVYQEAREKIRPSATGGNPSAQHNLGLILTAIGESEQGKRLIQISANNVLEDFFHPTILPLLTAAIELNSRDTADGSSDAYYLLQEAERRTFYHREFDFLEDIREARRFARESYNSRMAELKRMNQERETAKRNLGLFIFFLALSGMGGGGDAGGGGGLAEPSIPWDVALSP